MAACTRRWRLEWSIVADAICTTPRCEFRFRRRPTSSNRPRCRMAMAGNGAWSPRARSAAAALGRLRIFRYEIRAWRDGEIPDVAEAVDSPRRLTESEECARHALELIRRVPTPVWGRDELRTGEMWNSNSIVAWLLARTRLDADSMHPPHGGRAPGWAAGLAVARGPRISCAPRSSGPHVPRV